MKKRFLCVLVCALGLGVLALPSAADDQTAAEISALKQQLAEQAAVIQALQSRLEAVEARQTEPIVAEPEPEPVPMSDATPPVETSPETEPAPQPSVGSKYPIDVYGYLRLDAAYDTSGVTTGNVLRWVDPRDVGRDDDQLDITARQSRLGLRIQGPDFRGAETGGVLEMDFYGGGSETAPTPRLRHAYFTMTWPEYDVEILAGQTRDLFSRLLPRTVNLPKLWWTGNIGSRRPQLRLTKGFSVGEGKRLELALAATRNVGDTDLFAFGEDTGSDAGFPGLQGRLRYSYETSAGRTAILGVSGHYAEEEYDYRNFLGGRSDQDVESWSANIEATLPIGKYLLLLGEAFTGANLDAYVGGIGQGVVVVPFEDGDFRYARAIRSHGGWLNLQIDPPGKWQFSLGAGLEDVDDGDLFFGARSRNRGVFANVAYFLSKNIELDFELHHQRTNYRGGDDASVLRLQSAAIFKF